MAETISVVVADDHALIRSAVVAALNATQDIRVVREAASAEEAAVAVSESRPDVLILDLEMPGQDSFQLIHDLRRDQPGTAVVILTGNVFDRLIQAARQSGVRGYVAKADRVDAIIEGVRAVAAGGTYFSHSVRDRFVSAETATVEASPTKGGRLSDREIEVLRYVGRGFAKKQIADMMSISVKTVDKHVTTVMEKLDIHDRVELARYAIREGLIRP